MTTDVADAPGRRVTLDELRAHREEIEEIGRQYGVSNVRVFGSVARGDADDDSDLDLLIDVGEETGLFDLDQLRTRRRTTHVRLHPSRDGSGAQTSNP